MNEGLLSVMLTTIKYAARDTNLYELSALDGTSLPAADPGCHIDLHLPTGMIRQYSLLNPEARPTSYWIGVKRDRQGSGGSVWMHDTLKVGDILEIGEPRNNFELVDSDGPIVLIAGGIGITPIKSMVTRLEERGDDWHLYYSCRSRQDTAFLNEFAASENVTFNFDAESGGPLNMREIVEKAPKSAHLYCCGPLPMLAAFEDATAAWPSGQVHVEFFEAKDAPAREGGFVVELSRSGQEFYIPEGRTILEVLRDGGVPVSYSCEEGTCGSCETRVVSGIPDHRDVVLTEEEHASNEIVMICCAGCKSDRLVLDL